MIYLRVIQYTFLDMGLFSIVHICLKLIVGGMSEGVNNILPGAKIIGSLTVKYSDRFMVNINSTARHRNLFLI